MKVIKAQEEVENYKRMLQIKEQEIHKFKTDCDTKENKIADLESEIEKHKLKEVETNKEFFMNLTNIESKVVSPTNFDISVIQQSS